MSPSDEAPGHAPRRGAAPPGARTDRRRVRGGRQDPRAGAQPPRAGPLRRHVERALLLQVVAAASAPPADRGRQRCSSARGRTPASSTPATASPSPSGSRATTTPPPSSPTRARPPASAASCATSSPWGPARWPSWTRSSSARPTTPRQRWLVEGVVSGISGYGNSVGVPTVGGELTFDPCYAQNPLVNVLCLGALPTERLVLGHRLGSGQPGRAARARAPGATASAG